MAKILYIHRYSSLQTYDNHWVQHLQNMGYHVDTHYGAVSNDICEAYNLVIIGAPGSNYEGYTGVRTDVKTNVMCMCRYTMREHFGAASSSSIITGRKTRVVAQNHEAVIGLPTVWFDLYSSNDSCHTISSLRNGATALFEWDSNFSIVELKKTLENQEYKRLLYGPYIYNKHTVDGISVFNQIVIYLAGRPYNTKYLVQDGDEIKAWDNDLNSYIKVGDMPLSEEIFINFGMERLPASFIGILNSNPKLHLYTDDEDVVESPSDYRLELVEKKLSLPKIVIENEGRYLQEKVESITIEDIISGSGDIKYALSKDKENWYSFDVSNLEWKLLDITSDTEFSSNGMDRIDFSIIRPEQYEEIFEIGDKLYLAFRFYKESEVDECKFKSIKINYISPVDTSILTFK